MSKKILFFDLETTPNLSYTWGKWEQNVIAFKEEWQLLSFSYKWLGEKEVYCIARNDFRDKTDKSLTKALKDILASAEVLVAHNGDEFDIKKSNAKFVEHGLGPLAPFQRVDTKKVAKRYFKFNSNSLDDLGNLLGVGRKQKTGGFDLWLGCMAGDNKSFESMKKYNKQDVVLLEKVYLKLLPWMEQHPNMSTLYDKPMACPKCAGTRLKSKGISRTKTTQYRRYLCLKCGGYCKSRTAEKGTFKPELV
jgi:uncharacterized protein YprB with RNaseH-like and TPR domain